MLRKDMLALAVVSLASSPSAIGCVAATAESAPGEEAAQHQEAVGERNPKLREDFRQEYHAGYGDRVCYRVSGPHIACRLVETERMTEDKLFAYSQTVYGGKADVLPPAPGDELQSNGEWKHGGDYWIVADGDYIFEGCYPTWASAFGYSAQVIECKYRSHWASWTFGTDSGSGGCTFSWFDAISGGFCAYGLATAATGVGAAVAVAGCTWSAVDACL